MILQKGRVVRNAPLFVRQLRPEHPAPERPGAPTPFEHALCGACEEVLTIQSQVRNHVTAAAVCAEVSRPDPGTNANVLVIVGTLAEGRGRQGHSDAGQDKQYIAHEGPREIGYDDRLATGRQSSCPQRKGDHQSNSSAVAFLGGGKILSSSANCSAERSMLSATAFSRTCSRRLAL